MDGTRGYSSLYVCCPEAAFLTGVTGSQGDGEHSQRGRDVLMKPQQLCAKVVACQMLLQLPWGSPGEGTLSRSSACMFQPIHSIPTWLEVNVHLVLSEEVSLPFCQTALSFEGGHYFPVPFQLFLLRIMSLVLPE